MPTKGRNKRVYDPRVTRRAESGNHKARGRDAPHSIGTRGSAFPDVRRRDGLPKTEDRRRKGGERPERKRARSMKVLREN